MGLLFPSSAAACDAAFFIALPKRIHVVLSLRHRENTGRRMGRIPMLDVAIVVGHTEDRLDGRAHTAQ